MKNKKRTFFVVMAIILTAGVYYFYSRRDKKSVQGSTSGSQEGKLRTYSWIGCNSCPSEGVNPVDLSNNRSGFAGIHIGQGFTATGKVAIGDQVQIITNRGSDVEGTYEVIGIGGGCNGGNSGYPNLIVIDLAWNCNSHPTPSTSDGGVLRIIRN